jgi:hypothetical protein
VPLTSVLPLLLLLFLLLLVLLLLLLLLLLRHLLRGGVLLLLLLLLGGLCLRPGCMELPLGLGPCHIDHLLTQDLLELLLHLRTTDTHGTSEDDDDE